MVHDITITTRTTLVTNQYDMAAGVTRRVSHRTHVRLKVSPPHLCAGLPPAACPPRCPAAHSVQGSSAACRCLHRPAPAAAPALRPPPCSAPAAACAACAGLLTSWQRHRQGPRLLPLLLLELALGAADAAAAAAAAGVEKGPAAVAALSAVAAAAAAMAAAAVAAAAAAQRLTSCTVNAKDDV